jgi:2-succinyl-5-enolpyruvyl-6-hydroxy-3-cyclohexene-1-carboxylate synthase
MIHQTALDFVSLAAQRDVLHFVICPGSRSAPLTIALSRHPEISTYVLADERSAAYVALGLSQALGKTVGLVCTSGTAVLNFYPAIAEAYYQGISLLVCTADRPMEWVDQQDGQTLRQDRVFATHCEHFLRMPEQYDNADVRLHLQFKINEAITICEKKGPVHINFPFREPLYPCADETMIFEPGRLVREISASPALPKEQLNTLMNQWLAAPKRMVVAGQMKWNKDMRDAAYACRYYNSIPVLADVTSNLHGIENLLYNQDWLLGQLPDDVLETFRPDLLVTVGGSLISKNLKQFIRRFPPKVHWHVQATGEVPDTFRSVTHVIRHNEAQFMTKLGEHGYYARFNQPETEYFLKWKELDSEAKALVEQAMEAGMWNEFAAAKFVLHQIPEQSILHVANSMPIRYANFFNTYAADMQLFANRGTSGIDGCVSTAVGHCLATHQPVYLLVGDVAFFYDRNGLWHQHLKPNLKIILLNNRGGNIFRMIDGPARQPELETYFETAQNLNAAHVAAAMRLNYFQATNMNELIANWPAFATEQNQAAILEIFTDKVENAAMFAAIKQHLKKYLA